MKNLLVVIFAVSIFTVQAQKDDTVVDSLSSKEFQKIINKQFSQLITGHSSNSIGTFASLDINKPKVSFTSKH